VHRQRLDHFRMVHRFAHDCSLVVQRLVLNYFRMV
jgi:hypothetical protein